MPTTLSIRYSVLSLLFHALALSIFFLAAPITASPTTAAAPSTTTDNTESLNIVVPADWKPPTVSAVSDTIAPISEEQQNATAVKVEQLWQQQAPLHVVGWKGGN